jgi:AMMECR1 domain-containing protein
MGFSLLAGCMAVVAAAGLPAALVGSAAAQREAVALARQALASEVTGSPITLRPRSSLSRSRCGAFVILVVGSRTRACAGTVEPTCANAAAEIEAAAALAAAGDPWHPPLREADLKAGRVEVCLAGPPSRIASVYQLDVRREGLLLRSDGRSAVILPGEAKTAAWALREARRKAGLRPKDGAELLSFPAVRWREAPARRQERNPAK